MSFDVGFNFRGTSGYVTDGVGETYVIDADNYPTTRGGATFGEEDEFLFNLDRNAANDRRLAGVKADSVIGRRFRVDLPATGDYDIHLALGDAASAQTHKWDTKDDTTTLDTYNVMSSSNQFFDASGVQRTAANWPGSEVSVTRTFASTIFRLQTNAASSTAAVAHLRLVQVESGIQADVPVGIIEYAAVTPSARKSATSPLGQAETAALAPASSKRAAAPLAASETAALAPTAAKSAAAPLAAAETTALAPTRSSGASVPLGTCEYLAIAPTTSKSAAAPLGSVEYVGLSPTSTIDTPDLPVILHSAASAIYEHGSRKSILHEHGSAASLLYEHGSAASKVIT